ncbi:MAG: hypothetical protein Q9M91_07285 [Candidatus Dojkabacteria bacterium]|nr:hypothetical protein [Candidatus Dojkabacteria bacterium]MDQ7021591.1 hypothetical protein [Candidatus Dojkabacteria bacterium]
MGSNESKESLDNRVDRLGDEATTVYMSDVGEDWSGDISTEGRIELANIAGQLEELNKQRSVLSREFRNEYDKRPNLKDIHSRHSKYLTPEYLTLVNGDLVIRDKYRFTDLEEGIRTALYKLYVTADVQAAAEGITPYKIPKETAQKFKDVLKMSIANLQMLDSQLAQIKEYVIDQCMIPRHTQIMRLKLNQALEVYNEAKKIPDFDISNIDKQLDASVDVIMNEYILAI